MKRFFTLIVALLLAVVMMTSAAAVNMAVAVSLNTPMVGIELEEQRNALRAGGRRQRRGARHHRRHKAHKGSKAARKAAKETALKKAVRSAYCECNRRHNEPLRNEAASWAKFRWPKEDAVAEAPTKHSVVRKVLRAALLLPLMPLMGIGFGARTVRTELPEIEPLAKMADEAQAAVEAATIALHEAEDRVVVEEDAIYQEYEAPIKEASDECKLAKAKLNALEASRVDLIVKVNEAQEALLRAMGRETEARANLEASLEISRPTTSWAQTVSMLSNEAQTYAHKAYAIRAQALRNGKEPGKDYTVMQSKADKAFTAYTKESAAYNAKAVAAADAEEAALLLYEKVQEAAKAVAAAKANFDNACEKLNETEQSIEDTAYILDIAKASVKRLLHIKAEAKRIIADRLALVNSDACDARIALCKAQDVLTNAQYNYNAAMDIHHRVENIAVEEPTTATTSPVPVRKEHKDAMAQAVVHARRACDGSYVAVTNSNGRMRKNYWDHAAKADTITTLKTECINSVDTGNVDECVKYVVYENGVKKTTIMTRLVPGGKLTAVKTISGKIAASVFAAKVTANLQNNHVLPSGTDYNGRGYNPKYQLVQVDPSGRVCSCDLFGNKEEAEREFAKLSSKCYVGWQAQLFHYGVLERRTGDNQELSMLDGQHTRQYVIDKLIDAGVTRPRAIKIADHFGIEFRAGEAELRDAVENSNLEAITVIQGVGKATALKVVNALKGELRSYEEALDPLSRYVDITKLIFDGTGPEVSKIVHVKRGQLYSFLEQQSRKMGIDPKAHPVYMYVQQALNRKLKGEKRDIAKDTVKDWVLNGIKWVADLFRYTLHGTNAAKQCTGCLVREDLVKDAIAFCTADANPKALFTVAKRMAYMGLKLVGTDDSPFPFKAEWVYIGRDMKKFLNDRVIKVTKDDVADVADSVVEQNAFDGAGIMHFSDKVKKQILDGAKNEAERAKYVQFFKELDAHTGRVLPFMKSMNIVCFDIHKFFADRGITHLKDGRAVEDVVFFGTKSCFKGSIGPDGTHASWNEFCDACAKYQYHAGAVLHAHDLKESDLSSQQIQTLSGISRETVKKLVANAAARVNLLANGKGLERISGNPTVAKMLKYLPQMAAQEQIAKKLQTGFDKVYKLGLCGKLYGESTSAFVFPDPIALATWLAYEDEDKVEYAINPWEIVSDDPQFEDGQEVVISRNPCTDLSALCVVTVRKSFGKYDKYFNHDYHVVFGSVLDTTATRLRMDYDGDHIVIVKDATFVAAVKEAVALWYPGEDRHPVIDWVAPEGTKIAVSDEDIINYFCGMTESDQLGRYMDLLTKLYGLIPCGTTEIYEDTKKAVAWLTYAVNVLVDASKHGGTEITMPDFVEKFADACMSRTVAESKKNDGKDVNWEKVQPEYGDGILDIIAVEWMAKVPKEFKLLDCDYTVQFDPTALLSELRADHKSNETLNDRCMAELRAVVCYNLVGDDHWHFYPYLRNENGEITTQIPEAGNWLKFGPRNLRKYFDSMQELNEYPANKRTKYVILNEEESSKVLFDTGKLDENGELIWEEISGKWVHNECELGEDALEPRPASFFQILEGRKHEIENSFVLDENDANDKIKACADRAKLRKYTSWAALQSIRAYASLYGCSLDEALDKILIWALRPRGLTDKGQPEKKPNPFQVDFMFDVFSDMLVARARKAARYNMVHVRFTPGGTLYGYLTRAYVARGQQVVVKNFRGENQILTVVESEKVSEDELIAYANAHGFAMSDYKVARVHTA